MTIDDWRGMCRHGGYDRTRPALPETLEPGDVDDQGNVLTASGIRYGGGVEIWVTERQMAAAWYYRWRPVGDAPASRRDIDGTVVYRITR